MERPKRPCVREINAHLICVLCGGYYVDATTISECLHSFCRSCIVKYLETNRFCPICDVQLHKAKPLLSIRPDKILQRLVYKMVPGLYSNEMQRRRSFYSNTELQSSTDSESCDSYQHNKYGGQEFFSPEDSISLSLEYYDSAASSDSEADNCSTSEKEKKQIPHRRYLQCPAAVTTNHLKKFVGMKYGLTTDHKVDIIYEDECLPDYFSLIDVAYTFSWDRTTPMRFCYRILKKSTITTTVPNNVVVPEAAPASSELNETSGTPTADDESLNKTTGQQMNDRIQGKDGLRDDDCAPIDEDNNNCATEEDSEEPPEKKLRLSTKADDASRVVEDDKMNEEEQSMEMECNPDDSNMLEAVEEDGEDEESDENTDKSEKINNENFQTDENVNENETSNGAEGDETPEDFILQNDQQMDINDDDLEEEDDDEDRLRICDPEEDITEDRTTDDAAVAEAAEEPNEEVQTEEAADEQVNAEEPTPQQQPDNEEVEEEEEEEERPKEVPKIVEYKSRKKNKKGKHHHHHRHKRDYHPAAEILHSETKNDIMKLKVKLTAVKSDENSKYYRLNSHSPSRHKHYVISEESDNVSNHSQEVSNADDDSRNSQLTDIDVASSKEGQDSDYKGSPASSSSGSKHDSSNKERLLQMRAVRHKQVTSSPKDVTSSSSNGTASTSERRTVNDVNKSKSSIILQPPSSITVSKITAAEKRKMDEEKLLMMSGKNNNNGLDNNRPSVEIMLVNAPKQNDNNKAQQGDKHNDKMGYKTVKSPTPGVPLVNIIKTTAPMASPTGQRHPSSLSISSKLHNKIQNNVKTSSVSPNSEKTKYSLNKSSTEHTNGSNSQGKGTGGTHDDVGALDLSGKSSRKSSSSSMSSETSSCPLPGQNALSVAQSLVQRHQNHSPAAARSSSNSPSDVATPAAHSSPDPGRTLIPPSMWNLMTLSDTAVHIRNMKAAQDGPPTNKPPTTHSQKNLSPQRSLPSPSKSPSAAANRSSPAPLKIPVPNLPLNNKNMANKNRTLPNLNEITSSAANRNKTGMLHNRNNNNNNIPLNKPGVVRPTHGMAVQPRPSGGLNFTGMINRQGPSPAVAKKQAGINGRGLLIPPPPPAIPISSISSILKMENMTRKYDIDKMASGLKAVKAAVEAYGGKL